MFLIPLNSLQVYLARLFAIPCDFHGVRWMTVFHKKSRPCRYFHKCKSKTVYSKPMARITESIILASVVPHHLHTTRYLFHCRNITPKIHTHRQRLIRRTERDAYKNTRQPIEIAYNEIDAYAYANVTTLLHPLYSKGVETKYEYIAVV